jgi:hypothetical protein
VLRCFGFDKFLVYLVSFLSLFGLFALLMYWPLGMGDLSMKWTIVRPYP